MSRAVLHLKVRASKGWEQDSSAAVYLILGVGDQSIQTVTKGAVDGIISWDQTFILPVATSTSIHGVFEISDPLQIEMYDHHTGQCILQHVQRLPKLSPERNKSISTTLTNGTTLSFEAVLRPTYSTSQSPVRSASASSSPGRSGDSRLSRSSLATRSSSYRSSSAQKAAEAASLSQSVGSPSAVKAQRQAGYYVTTGGGGTRWVPSEPATTSTLQATEAPMQVLERSRQTVSSEGSSVSLSPQSSVRSGAQKVKDGVWQMEDGKMVRREVYRISNGASRAPTSPDRPTVSVEQLVRSVRALTPTQLKDLYLYILGLEVDMTPDALCWAAVFINPLKDQCSQCQQSLVWMTLLGALLQRCHEEAGQVEQERAEELKATVTHYEAMLNGQGQSPSLQELELDGKWQQKEDQWIAAKAEYQNRILRLELDLQTETDRAASDRSRIQDLEHRLMMYKSEPGDAHDVLRSELTRERARAEHLETRVLALQKTMHEQMEQHRTAQTQAQAETQKAERLLAKMNESMNESSGNLHAQLARERTRAEHLGRQLDTFEKMRSELTAERTRAEHLELQLKQLQAGEPKELDESRMQTHVLEVALHEATRAEGEYILRIQNLERQLLERTTNSPPRAPSRHVSGPSSRHSWSSAPPGSHATAVCAHACNNPNCHLCEQIQLSLAKQSPK
uniref:C2 domain-containing protein n=1 Tax=Eutreptiella gymnastica TaxID=73025 RepID=A0A7S1N241_9EUGL|mmetsp:Transcript_107991/g.186305  ORF Transcript_107991/g.186305 Transcript_107991/m.186305 type:complete len:679 (+) Transcript_107991:57-2093(+)